jgi:hypothetical protein
MKFSGLKITKEKLISPGPNTTREGRERVSEEK